MRCALVTGVQTCALPIFLASLLGLLTIIWLFTPEPHADTEPATRNGLTSVSTVIGGIAVAIVAIDALGFALTVFLLVIVNMSEIGRAACRERVCRYV